MAALAGVGIKTVSRVINNEANVSAPMRERVQHAVVALNFQPNQGAGALRRINQRTGTLGLLLDAVDNPFSAAVNRAVESVAAARGTAVFAASFHDDPAVERSLIDAFARRRVDGLVLTTISPDHGYLRSEQEQGTPIVFIDRPPVGLAADAVLTDNYEASATATRHLLEHGHRRIAHLADELAISTSRERRRAFADGMAAGTDGDERTGDRQPLHVDDLTSQARAEAAVRELMALAEPPTAIFASQNLITVGALRALHDLGLQHEVALVGFDDLLLADLVDPAVTVIAQDPIQMGTLAAERVFARLDGDTSPASTLVVPSQLVVRGSGEIRPPGGLG
ncbi:LacI family DNA-binding transcriptional regulator [uncultured Friedmanniella sp.]|uniref:LacI family DNA-binding transcriptional regulator n=1 Tax=uncultured Friedmanniella sp. TaxID=335381 RepID=UPI0035CB7D20